MESALEVFCCYARKDQPLLNQLRAHLMPLQHQGLITLWADTDIGAGAEWEKEIEKHLDTAQIILLLVSPDFMTSKYCYSKEMQRAMERHNKGEACLIPIILRPIYWQGVLGHLQALPAEGKPITSWSESDEAFFKVAEGIRKEVEKLSTKPKQITISIGDSILSREREGSKVQFLDNISLRVKIASIAICLMLIISVAFVVYSRTGNFLTSPTSHFLYQADWSKGMNGWVGESEWTVSDGGILASNGNVKTNNAIVAPYQPKTANYAVEAQIKLLRPMTSSTSAFFGIFVRSGPNPDVLGYDCYVIDNIAKIRKAAPQTGIILNQKDYPLDTSWHTYQVEIKGSTATFFIDNKLVLDANDSTYTQPGMVGLFDNNSQINVRSFLVSPL